MAGFTKLFSSLVTSSVWGEDDATVRVWIAMLAMSDATGNVEGSIPGFAHVSRVTISDMVNAVERLSSPDPYSRSSAHEGRRIQAIPGGWKILNYVDYRSRCQAKDGSRASYMRNYRSRNDG